jgi:hypothetical protein
MDLLKTTQFCKINANQVLVQSNRMPSKIFKLKNLMNSHLKTTPWKLKK